MNGSIFRFQVVNLLFELDAFPNIILRLKPDPLISDEQYDHPAEIVEVFDRQTLFLPRQLLAKNLIERQKPVQPVE
ncbi:hypothetical protein D3C86_1914720 [compost metagenome]